MIRIGPSIRPKYFPAATVDPDAQAFITAASITDPTQQSAINTLVTDLKGYGIWTKMKAIYPFVGGTSSTHKWNLKDPRDLDAAFRLVFSGGWTHSSTGATPNGTNGYANTYLSPSGSLSLNSTHFSYYSRTNNTYSGVMIGTSSTGNGQSLLALKVDAGVPQEYSCIHNNATADISPSRNDGLFTATRIASGSFKVFRNSTAYRNSSITSTSLSTTNFYVGARNNNNSALQYTDLECAFASIGDGLTDTEAANLYTAVQKYQTTLGRSVGTQTVSDSDAQAFVNAAVIEDQVQATAINTLVTDLKGYGIWSKMKAIYPFVGGTSSAHKWNLKDPRDLDAAFRLVFSGGITHSSTGVLFNGTNGFCNTYLIPSSSLTQNSQSYSYYSRSNTAAGTKRDMGGVLTGDLTQDVGVLIRYTSNLFYPIIGGNNYPSVTNNDSSGLYISNRVNSTTIKGFKNNSLVVSGNQDTGLLSRAIYIGARNKDNAPEQYTDRECAFASIGDGLTDTEAANLYTAVQAYQTTLSRNV